MKNAMNFRPVGLMLLFCLIPLWAFAQSVMVKGVVKDTSGEAIIGASVLEKGTTNGTITDFDGNFALNVSKNAVLVVSFVGYKNEEIPVAGKSSLKMSLKQIIRFCGFRTSLDIQRRFLRSCRNAVFHIS